MSDAAASGLTIRAVTPTDESAVRDLVTAAFPSDVEARLVSTLRHCGALVLEQVAVETDGRVVGHIAFSRVTPAAIGRGQAMKIVCLAPVSVLPDRQKSGIGSALIRSSLERLTDLGEELVLVLGPPAYFPKFGFDAALATRVQGPYAGGAFMALALNEACKRDLPIEVAFATPFEDVD